MSNSSATGDAREIRRLVGVLRYEASKLAAVADAAAALVERVGFEKACALTCRPSYWLVQRLRLNSLPPVVAAAVRDERITSVKAALELGWIYLRSTQLAHDLLRMSAITQLDVRRAACKFDNRSTQLTTFGMLPREQREKISGRFLMLMEDQSLSDTQRAQMLDALARDAKLEVVMHACAKADDPPSPIG